MSPDTSPDPVPERPQDAPDLSYLSAGDRAGYEWLLSDHPWAIAERARRREAEHAYELAAAAATREWADRTRARSAAGDLDSRPAGWRDNLERLAEVMGPIADDAQLRTTIDAVEPDELAVVRERRRLELDWRVGGIDHVYPAHLIGPGAAAYPPPGRPAPQ